MTTAPNHRAWHRDRTVEKGADAVGRRAVQPTASAHLCAGDDADYRKEAVAAAVDLSRACRTPSVAEQNANIFALERFEAPSNYSRIRAWSLWSDYCQEIGLDPLTNGTSENVSRACQRQAGVSGPLSLWQRLDFLRRHLDAPLALPPKPIRQALDGVLRETDQGVVLEPVMLVRMQRLATQLKANNDWRLGALLGAS